MKLLLAGIAALSLSACATIVKPERQTVRLNGGLEEGLTKVRLPDGTHELTNGAGSIVVTRSREDIPIEVTCNGVTKKGVLPTRYDVAWGGLGNVVFGGVIGIIIDATGQKAYDAVSPYSVSELCDQRVPAAVPLR